MKKGADVLKGIHGKLYVAVLLGFPLCVVHLLLLGNLSADPCSCLVPTATSTRSMPQWTMCATNSNSPTRSQRQSPTLQAWVSMYVPSISLRCRSSHGSTDSFRNPAPHRSTTRTSQTNWPNWSRRSSTSDSQEQRPHLFIHQLRTLLVRLCFRSGFAFLRLWELTSRMLVFTVKTPAQAIEEDEEEAELRELQAQLAM